MEPAELIDPARAQRVQERIHPIDCDVTRWEACSAAVAMAVERFGAVHGLVNNAGVGMQHIGNVLVGPRKKFYEVDADTWRNAIDVNFNGPFMMAKAVVPLPAFRSKVGDIPTDGIAAKLQEFAHEFLQHDPAAPDKKREPAGIKN